ncbi:MAG: MBL fold metallo-hydrolase [Planctomycetota bacterium]
MVALAVGHGLAVLFQSQHGNLLYDAGSRSRLDVGRRVIVPALRALGVHQLDVLVISHFDADHVNGIPGLIEAFPPGICLVPARVDDRAFVRELIAGLEQAGTSVRAPGDAPWPDHLGPFRLRFSVADGVRPRSSNEESVLLNIAFSGRSALLTGDIEAEGVERAIRERLTEPTDVLFIPHHGMRCDGLPRLLQAATPRLALISGDPPRTIVSRTGPPPTLATYQYGALFVAAGRHGLTVSSFVEQREVLTIP